MINEWFWLWTPLCASILLSMILVPLGERVLQRGVVFADIAIAQWAALGVLLGGQLSWSRELTAMSPALSISGLCFALLASGLVHLILNFYAPHREAMIGTLYVAGASLATMSVSHDPHGAQALAATLNGDLLWTSPSHFYVLIPVAASVIIWKKISASWQNKIFLPLFALAVTVAVEVAGIYVVFATLISTPLLLCQIAGKRVAWAVLACIVAHFIGLLLAAWLDYPVGPSVVLSSILFTSLVLMVLSFLKRPTRAF
jgi:zinc/manganese transport system permease protein